MSLDVFNGFLKAIAKKEADRLRIQVTIDRVIQHGDNKEYKALLKEINDV